MPRGQFERKPCREQPFGQKRLWAEDILDAMEAVPPSMTIQNERWRLNALREYANQRGMNIVTRPVGDKILVWWLDV